MNIIKPLSSGYENVDYYGTCDNCDHNKYAPRPDCGYMCIVGITDSNVIVPFVTSAHTNGYHANWTVSQNNIWRSIRIEFKRQFFISSYEANNYAAMWASGFLLQSLIDSIADIFIEDKHFCDYCGHEL